VIGPSQRPNKTQYIQETNIHDRCGLESPIPASERQ